MNRVEQWLAAADVTCWLAAWFLPVMADYSGWDAFRAVLNPSQRDDAVPQTISALSNVAFLALLWGWWRKRLPRPSMFLKVSVIFLVLNLYWLVEAVRAGALRELRIGYYLWIGAFALLTALAAVNGVSSRRTSRTPPDGTPA